jgi:hypothetical protein
LIGSIGVLVTFPSGETCQLAPGPSSIISQAVIEVFAKRFLEKPAVLWLSESGNNMADAPVVKLPPSAHERFAGWKESPVPGPLRSDCHENGDLDASNEKAAPRIVGDHPSSPPPGSPSTSAPRRSIAR